ncbi:uncharacterized protein CTRU02_213919 [Colletotrichum truncatum]|uniref:Uncharacterized protein n=1 Tax=Colletotrichum truncatum TaxID=5467 RepID=A0ACC3YH43_COLTU|nr:uncharacterized protein CTRU02_06232 [Colletotrichum truncatum]KAF6792736.1 hypothetical protein CTRU02_06232 [Colletotrichum truncatum]
MKLSTVFTVFALVLTAQGCDTYKYCACTDENGNTDDLTTSSVCSDTLINDQGYYECNKYQNYVWVVEGIDNCSFRKACQAKGAKGDSKCRAKVGIFKFKA